MELELTEEQLKEKAIQYLRDAYGEDTVSMDVVDNSVEDGDGVFHVDCTVSVSGSNSDWTKWFTFRNGDVTNMRWQMK
jgi:hypothetical protein